MRSMEWNDADRRNPNDATKNLSQYYFVHHKSYLEKPGIEP
jgi:hypothetical protein